MEPYSNVLFTNAEETEHSYEYASNGIPQCSAEQRP